MLPLPQDKDVVKALFEKYVQTEKWQGYFTESTQELKRISNYTGLNFNEVLNLPYSMYLLYRRESWINSWRGTKEGCEFLETLWRIQQVNADVESIKKFNDERR